MFLEKEKPLIPQDEIVELAAHAGVDMTTMHLEGSLGNSDQFSVTRRAEEGEDQPIHALSLCLFPGRIVLSTAKPVSYLHSRKLIPAH